MKHQTNLFKYVAGLNLLFAPVVLAQTGDRGGNGGDVLVCKDGSVQMLDSAETADKYPTAYPLNLGDSHLSVREKVKIAITRVQAKDSLLASELNSRSNQLLDDIEAFDADHNPMQASTEFTTSELVNIPDEGMAKIPTGCEIKQLIVQTANPLPGKKKFTFQSDLWKRMNSDQRAAAITHEAIYSYLISKNAASSPVTRFFNGLAISNEMEQMSLKDYFQTVTELKFSYYVYDRYEQKFDIAVVNGYPIVLNTTDSYYSYQKPTFNDDGTLASAYLFEKCFERAAKQPEFEGCTQLKEKLHKAINNLDLSWSLEFKLNFNQGKLVAVKVPEEVRSDTRSTFSRYNGKNSRQLKNDQIPVFDEPTLTFSQDGRTFQLTGQILKYYRPILGDITSQKAGKAKAVYDAETGAQLSFEMIP